MHSGMAFPSLLPGQPWTPPTSRCGSRKYNRCRWRATSRERVGRQDEAATSQAAAICAAKLGLRGRCELGFRAGRCAQLQPSGAQCCVSPRCSSGDSLQPDETEVWGSYSDMAMPTGPSIPVEIVSFVACKPRLEYTVT